MQKRAAIAAAVVVAGFLGGIWAKTQTSQSDTPFAQCNPNAVAGDAIGGPFELVNAQGETVTDQDVITRPSLLYFGYTFCPDVCPLDTVRNADAVDLLNDMGHEVTPVFISIDPERDTPQAMGEYASVIHDRMIGLTGSAEQVKAASRAYKTYYKRQPSDDEFYLVDHSTFTYLVLPDYGFVDYLRRDLSPEQVADKVACFIEAS